MLSKAAFFLAFVAAAQVSVAAVPGCLLGAVNVYQNPGDIKAVCQSTDYASKIKEKCGDSTADALKAFAETCKSAGVTISTDTKSGGNTSPTGTPTGTGNNNNNSPSPTGNNANNNNQAGTQTTTTGAPRNTGAAGRLEVGTAALFAGVGLLAAAL